MTFTLPNWAYLVVLLAILLASGAGEYLHMVPAGSFYTVLILVIGLVSPSPVFPHAQVVTPAATVNTQTAEVIDPAKGAHG